MPESGFAERTILGMTGFAFSTAAVLVAAYSPLLADACDRHAHHAR